MTTNYVIAVCAGLVSAALFASSATGTILGLFVLFFLSPLPVAVAGLGWGWRAALLAAVVGAITVGVIGNWRGSVFFGLALGAPTAVLSYYCLLNRDVSADDGTARTEWYPLGRIVALAALIAGALAALALLNLAPDMDELRRLLGGNIERLLKRPAGAPAPVGMPDNLEPAQIAGLANLMVSLFTVSLATLWLAVATLNMWLAAHVVARSGRLVRPWPDLNQLRLPGNLPVLLAAALAGTFLPGFGGLIAAGFAAALLMAYVFVGLAIVHYVTRGQTMRPLILTSTYAALVLFLAIVGPLLALLALAEPFFPFRTNQPPGRDVPPLS